MKKFYVFAAMLLVASMTLASCAPATPVVVEPPAVEKVATFAIEHFSVIEGTTWSGAHDRAGKRIAEKYPNVTYIYRENVGPDLSIPYAEEMITAEGANIVIGNAEFM
ncbi:MAG: hypothetical protein ABIL11_05600, partial [Chloroflexota bacterium]